MNDLTPERVVIIVSDQSFTAAEIRKKWPNDSLLIAMADELDRLLSRLEEVELTAAVALLGPVAAPRPSGTSLRMGWEAWEAGLAAELDRGMDAHGYYNSEVWPLKFRRSEGLWTAEVTIRELSAQDRGGRNQAEGKGLGLREATSMAVLEVYRRAALRSGFARQPPELEEWKTRGPGREYRSSTDLDCTTYELSAYLDDGTRLSVSGLHYKVVIADLLRKAAALGAP